MPKDLSRREAVVTALKGVLCACCVGVVAPASAEALPERRPGPKPKPIPVPKKQWQRLCSSCRGDARFGPKRNTYKEALADVQAHLRRFPGHDAGVYP